MLRAVKYKFTEAPQKYWDFVHKHGSIEQSKPYLECLEATGREPLIIGVFKGEQLVGGAGVITGHKIFNFHISAGTYFAPVVEDKQIISAALRCITKVVKKMCLKFSVTVLPEHVDRLAENYELSDWHKEEIEFLTWDISKPIDELWQSLPKDKKASVKRARRDGVVIQEIESKQCVRQFYDLHIMTMDRGGLTAHRLSYYESLIMMLKPKGLATGFLALHPDTKEAIAGVILLLGMHGEAVHLSVGHNYEFRKFRGSDLLMWHCLEFLKSKRFSIFELVGLPKGDSARARGIRHFKTAWAGDNGRRRPSYILSRAAWGLNPNSIDGIVFFIKGLRKIMSK